MSVAPGGPRPGDRVADRYEVREEIGRGGMGRVFRARDLALGRDVAVKVLEAGACGDEDVRRLCLREARTAARLVHHGIAAIFDIGIQDGYSYLVMELVEGRTLREILRHEGALPTGRAVGIAIQVADALDYAHRHGVLHCDVKPLNVVVTAEGVAKLVDFGIARAANATDALSRDEVYGSAPYLAPEQVRGRPIDARSDVYALGLVLYEMLTGRPAFQGSDVATVLRRRIESDPPLPRSIDPTIPPQVEQALLPALSRDPARRYASAAAFRDALRAVSSDAQAHTIEIDRAALGKEPPTRTPSDSRPAHVRPRAAGVATRDRPRSRLALGALVLAMAALVVGLGLLLAAVLDGFGADLPGDAWATFAKPSCEWSNTTTPPAICFGERQPGFRVRVMEREGPRWLIWDPETRNVAYVDADALKEE
jgi:eukaryotic-like serine/threonine-protein kinase